MVAPAAVHALLLKPESRAATLDAIEAQHTIEPALALAAAPALTELLTAGADDVDHAAFCRVGLLLGRLHAEAGDDAARIATMWAAAFGPLERLGNMWDAADNVVARALRKPAAELDAADARAYACQETYLGYMSARGADAPVRAAGCATVRDWLAIWLSADPITSKKKMPEDAHPRALLRLCLEMLGAEQQPPGALQATGLWTAVRNCLAGRPAVGKYARELGIFEIAVSNLRRAGTAAEWPSISSGHGAWAGYALNAVSETTKAHNADQVRPDKEALLSSGLLDACLAAVQAFEQRGTDGVADTHHWAIYHSLGLIRNMVGYQPECRAKVRGIASSLAFALENDLPAIEEIGLTAAATAANICAGVFGRDDGGSEFVFTQKHVDRMWVLYVWHLFLASNPPPPPPVRPVRFAAAAFCCSRIFLHGWDGSDRIAKWSMIVAGTSWGATSKPSADEIFTLELVISDDNKPLLLANKSFLPYL